MMVGCLAAAVLAVVSPVNVEPPTFPAREFNVVDYGAKADGSNATDAFGKAISACAESGGGRVRVPAGTYFTGPVHLKSNVDFHLDAVRHVDFSGLTVGDGVGGIGTDAVVGGRYVFLGDSITKQAYWIEPLTTALYVLYPTTAFRFVNAGIAGDSARDALPRLKEDVTDFSPDRVTVMFGMNDVKRDCYVAQPTREQVDEREMALLEYPDLMRTIANRISASCPGTQICWLTPTPYDEDVALTAPVCQGVAAALTACSRQVQVLAAERGEGVVDLNACVTEANALGRQSDPAFTLCGTDRIHPKAEGGSFIARQILKSWGVKPKVFEIGVDLRAGSVCQSEGVSVTNIRQTQDEVSFEAIEKALPLKGFAEGERVSVSGLADGEWTLSIDGNMVLTTNAEAFAAGVCLAGRPTPQALQSEQVKTLNHERVACESDLRTLAGARWYLFAKGVDPDDGDAVEAWVKASEGKDGYYERLVRRYANEWPGRPARLERLADLENRIDSARRPLLRVWRLRK